jgi:hypothetical protein
MSEEKANLRDGILQLFITIVEDFEQQEDLPEHIRHLGITLNVGGILISGDLISHKTYIENDVILNKVKELLNNQQPSATTPEQEVDASNVLYIHLKNAKFFQPGQPGIPTKGEGFLWRGRLDCVDGFALGKIGFEEHSLESDHRVSSAQ